MAPLLTFLSPPRYVGVEASEEALGEAVRQHTAPGREFIVADLREVAFERWRGADIAVVSSVMHHLADDEVVAFARRIRDELVPTRLLVQDAEPHGRLGPVVRAADDGRHLRTQARLVELLAEDFDVKVLWTYVNPVRSFRQFLLDLTPHV